MKKVFVPLLILVLFSACAKVETSQNSLQKKFGNNTYYFLALQAAEAGNEQEAQRLFKLSRKKGNSLIARRSAESLTLLGSVGERLAAADFLVKNYDDEASLITACRCFFLYNEFAKVIALTDKISIETAKNELVKIRLKSLAQKKDSRFDSEFYKWFTSRGISSEHLESYETYVSLLNEKNKNIQAESEKFQKNLNKRNLLESQLTPDSSQETGLAIEPEEGFEPLFDALKNAENPDKSIIDYRIMVFHRQYAQAFLLTDKILKIYENRGDEIEGQMLSDIGKSILYGTTNYYNSARNLDALAKKLSPEKAYFAYFYAARLYDKAGRYPAQTVSRFHSALEATKDPMQFDNCLWYLLNFQLRTSTDDIISTLTKYGSKINAPEYFDDFFESLSILLLSSQKWQDFYKIWKQTDSNFSDYTEGKFAYISGRLIEEGLAQGEAGLKTRQAVDAFARVLNSNASLYYKVCAIERLNLTAPELIESYLLRQNEPNKNTEDEKSATEEEHGFASEAQVLIEGYAAFGFPERIYPEWLANRKSLTVEDSIKASRFLSQCAESRKDNSYNVQSLRIAARSLEMSTGNIPKELMTFAFPQVYKSIIDGVSEEFGVPNYLIYALVRSESFFDSSVTSKAGANGLTQLMESTADDEARKLKINENGGYDIFDPETNVRMGTHYLSSLIGRTDGKNKLLALYAYNAGLTNVRNWGKRFRNDWLATGKAFHKPVGISMDLFLESLPFAETREYGRKVVSAAAMYAYLYDNKLPGQTVREIMYE